MALKLREDNYTLSTIAKVEATQIPLIDESIKKIWCVYTVEYYSALKKKKGSSHTCYNVDELWECYANGNKPLMLGA